MRAALELNAADAWIPTNLDVLSGFDEIRVGVGYRQGGQRWSEYPAHLAAIDDLEVEYEALPGWTEDLTGLTRYEDLPSAVRTYVEYLERAVGVPVALISVGPERDQIVTRRGAPRLLPEVQEVG